jgi:putative transposase
MEGQAVADLSFIPEAAWSEARRRAEVIRPLSERDHRPRSMVQAAAVTLGLSERQTYTLLRRCREAGGELTALIPGRSSGGRNRLRTAPASEAALRRVVQEVYLTPQRPTAAEVAREVAGRCRAEKLRAPSSSTVRRRLRSLPVADRRKHGEEHPGAKPVHGHAPPVRFPLDLV